MEEKYCGNTITHCCGSPKPFNETRDANTVCASPRQRQLEKGFKTQNSMQVHKLMKADATLICKDMKLYAVVENDAFNCFMNAEIGF